MTLFQQVPDNNNVKLILWQFLRYFGTVFCHYTHVRVSRKTIRLIKEDLSYLQQHASNLCLFLLKISDNQWQNIMGILKNVFKIPPPLLPPIQYCQPITLLDASFALCSSTLLRGGKGSETQNCPNSSFSHNFCHWLKIALFVLYVTNNLFIFSIFSFSGKNRSSL